MRASGYQEPDITFLNGEVLLMGKVVHRIGLSFLSEETLISRRNGIGTIHLGK
ncbi:hypothetical protein SDC9_136032 [bioreactor metagenome]|uniref:Uncharacterized protein n=1 Tax=bioreactor metagenome TaxID=1076179 RepID=A0A645DIS6_9ZZZZ